jgi:hypothetical protein
MVGSALAIVLTDASHEGDVKTVARRAHLNGLVLIAVDSLQQLAVGGE